MARSDTWISLINAGAVAVTVFSAALAVANIVQNDQPAWVSVVVVTLSTGLLTAVFFARRRTSSPPTPGIGMVPISLLAISLVTGIVLVLRGGSGLRLPQTTTPADPAVNAWHLAVIALISGALSCAALEFVKKLSPLAMRFNRRAVVSSFGTKIEDGKFRSGAAFSELSGLPTKISYAGNLRQVAAQVSQSLREQCRADLSEATEDRDALRRFISSLGPQWPMLSPRLVERLSYEELLQLADEQIERRVDAFQIEATAHWHSSLRAASALIACALSGAGTLASGASVPAIAIALALGLVVGGPVSWTVRDIIRIIERGARR
ncbi:hypothetical protein [Amycolatopsis sp. NPDC051716]|uniref:hypothetical protein n=1 Tax=Amycolatopsis sp. NPDC051716 TaxID=3155804 RepID=UPI003418B3D3